MAIHKSCIYIFALGIESDLSCGYQLAASSGHRLSRVGVSNDHHMMGIVALEFLATFTLLIETIDAS